LKSGREREREREREKKRGRERERERQREVGENTTSVARWEFPGWDNPEGEANFRKLLLVWKGYIQPSYRR